MISDRAKSRDSGNDRELVGTVIAGFDKESIHLNHEDHLRVITNVYGSATEAIAPSPSREHPPSRLPLRQSRSRHSPRPSRCTPPTPATTKLS
ncbi:hypothetical protein ACTPOK_03265 [Streptomyces inhibens]|uniref:hypothetical protein n=1 Tax=Streptomyces inhibens TaxID=2293571 RepID=UPI00402AE838